MAGTFCNSATASYFVVMGSHIEEVRGEGEEASDEDDSDGEEMVRAVAGGGGRWSASR